MRLALVDDAAAVQNTVRSHFARADVGWQVAVYPSTAEAWQGIPAAPPHAVLMGDSRPAGAAMDCIRRLKARLPGLPVVLFTAQAQAGTVLRAMIAGAAGCLIKPLPPADLLPHLQKAMAGDPAFCPRAERLLLEDLHRFGCANTALGLSGREQELMLCLCQYRSDKECAIALGISEATVHAHMKNIFKKLAVHDRNSALHRFLENSPRA